MPIVKLSTGKRVRMVDEFGPNESLRAAELSEVPAKMSLADSMIFDITSTMVATIEIDMASPAEDGAPPKGFQKLDALLGTAIKPKDVAMAYRNLFTDQEWQQLDAAFDQVYAAPKAQAADEGTFTVES